jgi:hypothetical protein
MPKGAKCHTARNAEERANDGATAPFVLCVVGALSGISRPSAFRAVRHLALFGIRRWYCRALFGIRRWYCPAPFGI